ncbi:MAG: hypothetical protein COA73_09345 [Candidatus Hydrogenedentota bacterium]|nr:MAG: hypothetical protein COA73_09345 [Candidatus Hydrogenedentota bacterium]
MVERLKKLDLYILKQIAFPSCMALAVISFLAIATRIRGHFDDMPIDLLSMGDITRLCIYFLPPLAVRILPITYLIGVIWAMGQLTQSDELTAMKASGVSVKRMCAPIIAVGALLSMSCFWLQNYVQPWGITQAYSLIYMELPQRMTLDSLPTGEMHHYEDWRIYFRDKDTDERRLMDIDIIKPETDGNTLIHAESAQINQYDERFELSLEQGYTVMENGIYTHFDSMTLSIPAPSPKRTTSNTRYALSIPALMRQADKFRIEHEATEEEYAGNRLIKVQREIAERFSIPFAPIVMALAAAPLSARTRKKGHAVGFIHGALILLSYYVLISVVEVSSLESLGTVVLLGWIPNAVMLAVGAVMFYRSDSI